MSTGWTTPEFISWVNELPAFTLLNWLVKSIDVILYLFLEWSFPLSLKRMLYSIFVTLPSPIMCSFPFGVQFFKSAMQLCMLFFISLWIRFVVKIDNVSHSILSTLLKQLIRMWFRLLLASTRRNLLRVAAVLRHCCLDCRWLLELAVLLNWLCWLAVLIGCSQCSLRPGTPLYSPWTFDSSTLSWSLTLPIKEKHR